MRPRLSPSLLVVVLALVLAAGGVGYAAGKITSAQIKDDTIQSRDIKNGTVKGTDVKNGTIARAKLARGCKSAEVKVFGGCVRKASSGPSSYQAAIDDCSQRGGRLPTTSELFWIANHPVYAWANGNASMYEYTSDYTESAPFDPIALDRAGNGYGAGSDMVETIYHHCLTY